MGNLTWMSLPRSVRDGITKRIGFPIIEVREHQVGRTTDFTATIITRGGPSFVKAVKQSNQNAVHIRNMELRNNSFLPSIAPRILWHLDSLEWLVVGYEYVAGRPASFRVGSPDLPYVLGVLVETTAHHTVHVSQFESLASRWDRLSAWRTLHTTSPRVMEDWERRRVRDFIDRESYTLDILRVGTSVVHTDMHELNVLIGPRGARLVSWAWACRAPAWVDAAMLVVRLMEAGHSEEQAEAMVVQIPAWKEASKDAIDSFAVALLGTWILNSRWPQLTNAARVYATYRLGQS